jgi:LacI family transcriptional regulator
MATMKEIAALSGVSVATVSHVLSGKKNVNADTRDRVLRAVELTNYKLNTIAKSLRMNKTHIIGVLVEDICGLPVPEIVDGINEFLEASGYQVLLSNLRLLQKLYNQYEQLSQNIPIVNQGLQLLEDARVDGIIYVAMHDRRIKGVHQPVGIPMVYAFADSDHPDSICVSYDNVHSAREATRLLIRQHHRHIALIAGHPNSAAAKERLIGYREAMDETGLRVPPEYIRWGNWEYMSGEEQTDALLSLAVPPTAIFAMNDPMAAGCYAAVKRRGLSIPSHVSVVGFDNREVASCLYPGLTTVALPNKQIGIIAVKHLLERLNGQSGVPQRTTLPCSIIERSSTAPPA